MRKASIVGLYLLLLCLAGSSVMAQNATVENMYGAANELIGEDQYIYFDHIGTQVDVLGYRFKPFGVNGDLTDSGGGHDWTTNVEFAESLTGLDANLAYKVYAIAGGKNASGASENWGVQVGFETGVYSFATADVGDDDGITKYNLGLYQDPSNERYPFREVQGSSTALCMYAVLAGTVVADGSGNATVYINNVNNVDVDGVLGSRTWYDGLLVVPINDAFDPAPADGASDAEVENLELSWSSPAAGFTFDIYFGTEEPNAMEENYGSTFTKLNGSSAQVETSIVVPSTLAYSSTYYWVVDSYAPGSSTAYLGNFWSFTTIPFDTAPVVTAGSSYITWLDNLPQGIDAAVDDNGENDVDDADVIWAIETYAGDPVAASMQMLDRGKNSTAAQTLEVAGYDPNMLSEWIGTDSRQSSCDLIVMTLSGLPAGEYTWTSTHHDFNDQSHQFDVYVGDVLTGIEIDISNGDQIPTEYTTTLTSDGTNPVQISFEAYPETGGLGYGTGFFVMNAFELTDGVSTMKVDFGTAESTVAPGYEGYIAVHEDPATFTAQDFAFGSTTVTVLPQWGPKAAGWIDASVTKTSTDPLAPTAVFTTNYPGTYVLKLTATDDTIYGAEALFGSDTLEIQVADDACSAAQMSSNWSGFDYYDVDSNCTIDIYDFAAFAATWLDYTSLTAAEAY